jgi:hypothetical protein
VSAAAADLVALTVADDGAALDIHPHAGQWRALTSAKRIVLILAGTQSGKTSLGPLWLHQEMTRRGPGDYLVVTPTFPLLEVKALPEFRRLFVHFLALGTYQSSPIRHFRLSPEGECRLWGAPQDTPTTVYFGYAADPDSLESATVKAAWLDEAGQKSFKRASWEAIQRRLALNEGRVLITTTPYDLGWLKTTFYDPWEAAGRQHPEIDLITFPSTANPRFPPAELERARRDLPGWKFRMFYLGQFERPAGMIYDCFDQPAGRHVVRPFAIPADWPRILGLDFGGANTRGIFLAQERAPDGHLRRKWFAYRAYAGGGIPASGHVAALLAGEPMRPRAIGGSGSEEHWRIAFAQAGLAVDPPAVTDVEIGIGAVYQLLARDELAIFDTLTELRDEFGAYSRVLDAAGEPTEAIEDKATYHALDALRYPCTYLARDQVTAPPPTAIHHQSAWRTL